MEMNRRRMAIGSVVMVGLIVLGLVLLAFAPTPARPERALLTHNNRPLFLAGINYPWKTYQDFGTGAWGYSGVASATTRAEVDTDFANLAAQGVQVVKWRLFNDGRYSPEFDADGFVTGFDDKFYADLDAALTLARKHNLYLVFTLFASGLWTTGCSVQGVDLGGHAYTIAQLAKRNSLVRNAIVPLMQHIGHNDRVLAFEIVAEPEWGIAELNRDNDGRIKIPLAAMRAFVGTTAQAIHTYTDALATVESNRASNMQYWQGLGLDYYSFSWYDWLEPYDPLDRPYRDLGLDAPAVLGEFPVGSSRYYNLAQVLAIAYKRGYAGAFAWSYWGEDGYGKWVQAAPQYARWVGSHWSKVNLAGQNTPPPTGQFAVIPQPFERGDTALSLAAGALAVKMTITVRDGGDYVAKFYLQGLGGKAKQLEAVVPAQFDERQASTLSATFAAVPEGKVYKLSVGLFDKATSQLRKWFDGVTVLEVRDGQVAKPDLTNQQSENPCYAGR